MAAYYNEIDPSAAAWLRALIRDGQIADGDVDERSIADVQPDDIKGFDQCHFFAGIGGWSHALRLAGWPDDRPVWTGSCPCQPFSIAGAGAGFNDPRHLWPAWFRLISECQPPVVFGEQASSPAGRAWFDHVAVDLERLTYAVGATLIPAAGVGAPHKRERLYFVGHDTWTDANRREANGRHQCVSMGRQWCQGHHEALPDEPGAVWAIESRPAPVVDGVSTSLVAVLGFGNAIVPTLAASFIRAYDEARSC